MIARMLAVFLFSFNLYAETTWMLIHQDDHAKKAIENYFTIDKEIGRLVLLKPRLPVSEIPASVRALTQEVAESSIKVYQPVVSARAVDARKDILKLLERVSLEELKETVVQLSSISSRREGTQGNVQALAYLEQKLESYGLTVSRHCFDGNVCNLVAVKKGTAERPDIILVEAHMDSVGRPQAGADDNASGTAGLVEMARLVASSEGRQDIWFLITNAEESGLLGAKAFITQMERSDRLDSIKFVLNMDMIAYNSNGLVDLETNSEFENEVIWMSEMVRLYTSLTPNITMPAWGSDHVPFLQKGIAAVLTIEHWKTKTPCYHASCDRPDHLNYGYAAEIVKLNTAVLVEKSGIKL